MSATAGEEYTSPPVAYVQFASPVAASTAWSFLSWDPTKTTPSATAGEDRTSPPVAYVHFAALVGASRHPPPQPWICATSTAASTHRDPAPRETAHPPIVAATRETAETGDLSLEQNGNKTAFPE